MFNPVYAIACLMHFHHYIHNACVQGLTIESLVVFIIKVQLSYKFY